MKSAFDVAETNADMVTHLNNSIYETNKMINEVAHIANLLHEMTRNFTI
jgi:hypothetical protein